MEDFLRLATMAVVGVGTAGLMALSIGFIGLAGYNVLSAIFLGEHVLANMLEAVGLTVVALAVFDVGKFLFEEELLRNRELRSSVEARRTLTKFMTIIIIAVSLEALVYVFEAHQAHMSDLLYPAILLAVTALLIAAVAFHQYYSRGAEAVPRGVPDDPGGEG
ncbi:MAG TPA: hypothetical protein VEY95_03965 [Azospirillaceae bacterium]|nr:hypothetical protein [Azospirillaceae bacterium]